MIFTLRDQVNLIQFIFDSAHRKTTLRAITIISRASRIKLKYRRGWLRGFIRNCRLRASKTSSKSTLTYPLFISQCLYYEIFEILKYLFFNCALQWLQLYTRYTRMLMLLFLAAIYQLVTP